MFTLRQVTTLASPVACCQKKRREWLFTAFAFAAIIGFAAVVAWPFLWLGFWPFGGDAQIHINWYSHFSQQFWAGELYPRWLAGMNKNLGSPVFFFYPPLPFFITCLFKPLFPHDPQGWRQLGLSAYCALVGSGFSAYLWLRMLVSRRWPALLASLLFILMPYHLCADLYVRGAFAELWSFVWIPLILLFTRAVAKGSRRALLGLAPSYALLIMTHLPTTLTFSLIPIVYGWWSARGNPLLPVLTKILFAMILGMGIAAIYLVPAMTMQQYVTMEGLSRGLYYANSFFSFAPRTSSLADAFNQNILLMVLMTIGGAVWSIALALANDCLLTRREILFWSTITIACFLMMWPISQPVWRMFPALQIIQFPWRFSVTLCVAASAILALGLNCINMSNWRKKTMLSTFLLGAFVLAWVCMARSSMWTSKQLAGVNYATYPENSEDPPEWSPRWVGFDRDAVIEANGISGSNTARAELLAVSGKVDIMDWKPRAIVLAYQSPGNAMLLVRQFYFPGWSALLDGRLVPVSPSAEGLVLIPIPSGHHSVRLSLLRGLAERTGIIASQISLIILLGLGMRLFGNNATIWKSEKNP